MRETTLPTPEIIRAFDQHTTLKARAILADHFGRWLSVSGKLLDAAETFPGVVVLRIQPDDAPEWKRFEVSAEIKTERESERFSALLELPARGSVTVRGTFTAVAPERMFLADCEIVQADS